MNLSRPLFCLLLMTTANMSQSYSQTFSKITLTAEPTSTQGMSWSDYDDDGDLDLLVRVSSSDTNATHDRLFRNEGSGSFIQIVDIDLVQLKERSRGASWSDYDNDGDPDVFLANNIAQRPGSIGSIFYRNDGGGTLTRITSGVLGAGNVFSGLKASWGDYDNDGFVDLVMSTAKNAASPGDTLSNALFRNNRDRSFTRDTTSVVVTGPKDVYTIPTWSDHDLDGDLDLVITAGPIDGTVQPDYFFRNLLTETGIPGFERDTTSLFAVNSRDGQEARWIDYDNDCDFDLYITNYGGLPGQAQGMANDLYRNDSGSWTKITGDIIATEIDITLGQSWGDFDNDGDLDLYTSNQTSFLHPVGGNRYYRNEGPPAYNFSKISAGNLTSTARLGWGSVAGDYDNDGDLDLFVSISDAFANPDVDALYRNDQAPGNHWINIRCVGAKTDSASFGSNRSGIGAKVRAKATVFGTSYWQMREVVSQGGFNGHSSLRVHLGLGDAATIDSLVIEWPSSLVDVYTQVSADRFYEAFENMDLVTGIEEGIPRPVKFSLKNNYPNPFNPSTTITFTLDKPSSVQLAVFDLLGRKVRTLLSGRQAAGEHSVRWDGKNEQGGQTATGIYVYRINAGGSSESRKMLLLK